MPDIPTLSRLASQAPQHLKFANLFLREPLGLLPMVTGISFDFRKMALDIGGESFQ